VSTSNSCIVDMASRLGFVFIDDDNQRLNDNSVPLSVLFR
jgi:hypothetical protein